MNLDERIARINALYHKSKSQGLTDAEKEEQNKLRQEYIESVKKNLKAQLDSVDIVNEDGSVTNLGKQHGQKGNS
jgi:5-formyltetrahydrofolate cyclo-ligase